ncbi:hypothetical protein [Alloactinosynnema sp. L-07]|uniref:hypothetical protein n=1 Tax=Alloactinosynnema sp. L-07 TaxID=1653480 RepID=UPI00065EEF55|nr:hypothetical protein [Alloactinosynnema sp. L-07]CRK61366.1 hypothetical protein [Alloactinosynnema sp. L-07]
MAASGFGDPTVSWSILLRADLRTAPDAVAVGRGLADACARYPHLGPPPDVERADELSDPRARFAELPYADRAPRVRVAVGTDPPALLIAAHHGACDGLGLLALLSAALGVPVTSAAVGVGDRPSGESFVRSAARRVNEALFHPPARVEPTATEPAAGELLLTHQEPRARWGTGALTAAAAATVATWNRRHHGHPTPLVAAVGVSRRGGDDIAPRDDSAFLRLPIPRDASPSDIRARLAEQAPEPQFPSSPGPLTTLGTRLLAGRLGSSFLVSNLGPVSTSDEVRALAFHPAASGRSAVAFGAVTVADTTTLTLRVRARDFTYESAAELLSSLVTELREPDSGAAGSASISP